MTSGPWSCPGGELVTSSSAPEGEWLTARDGLIGASEVSKMLNLTPPWGGPYSLWTAKTGRTSREPTTDAQRRGQVLETAILDLWLERFAHFPIRARRQGLMRSRKWPHLGATVDRLAVCEHDGTESQSVIEIKSSASMSEWAENEVPTHIQLQGQAQLAVTGREHVHYVVMGPRFIPEHRVIERDEALIAEIGTRVEAWWERHIVDDIAPDPTAGDADAIRRRFFRTSTGTGSTYTIGPDDEPHVNALLDARREMAAAKETADTAQAILQDRLGDATELAWPDGTVVATWRAESAVDGITADFRKAHPDLVDRYSVPTTEVDKRKLIENEPWLLNEGILRRRRTFRIK